MSEFDTMHIFVGGMDIKGAMIEKFFASTGIIGLTIILNVVFLARALDIYRRRRKLGNILVMSQWIISTVSYFTLIFYNVSCFGFGLTERVDPFWTITYSTLMVISHSISPILCLQRLRLFDSDTPLKKELLYALSCVLIFAGTFVPGIMAVSIYISRGNNLENMWNDRATMLLVCSELLSSFLTLTIGLIAFRNVIQIATDSLRLKGLKGLITFQVCNSMQKDVIMESKLNEVLPCICSKLAENEDNNSPSSKADIFSSSHNIEGSLERTINATDPVTSAESHPQDVARRYVSNHAIDEYLSVIRFAESHDPKLCPKAAALNYRNSTYDPVYNASYMSSTEIRILHSKRLATKSLVLLIFMFIVITVNILSFMFIPDSLYKLTICLCLKPLFDSLDYVYIYSVPNVLKSF